MVQINWTQHAVSDLRDIHDFIARDSRKYAQLQVVKIRACVKILNQNPEAGRLVPEIGDRQYREVIEGNYRIIYKLVSKKRVDILTVHHSARDFISSEITK